MHTHTQTTKYTYNTILLITSIPLSVMGCLFHHYSARGQHSHKGKLASCLEHQPQRGTKSAPLLSTRCTSKLAVGASIGNSLAWETAGREANIPHCPAQPLPCLMPSSLAREQPVGGPTTLHRYSDREALAPAWQSPSGGGLLGMSCHFPLQAPEAPSNHGGEQGGLGSHLADPLRSGAAGRKLIAAFCK